MTSEEIEAIKSLFDLPLGSFPRGGIASSLKVKVISMPNALTLRNKSGSSFSITKENQNYLVCIERSGVVERFETSDFVEAVKHLTTPILIEEIVSKCQSL